jgi:hypothetical protein
LSQRKSIQKDGDYLVMCDTQIAQYMQPQEFSASALSVALAADAGEKKIYRW